MVAFLIWLLCIGITVLGIVFLFQYLDLSEGFSSSQSINSIVIKTCPASTTSYVTSGGDTNCCDTSDIVNRKCNGNIVCSLSPNSSETILSCSEWVMKEWAKRGSTFCAPSMPHYFGTINRQLESVEGCSASRAGSDGSLPQDPTMPKCKIYQTSADEYAKADSCFNIRARDAMATPIPAATKQIVATGWSRKKYPALLTATYLPPNAMVPVTCYDWDRVVTYFNSHDPSGETTRQWTKQYKDKYVIFCGPSKAYYIDKTLTKENAIGV